MEASKRSESGLIAIVWFPSVAIPGSENGTVRDTLDRMSTDDAKLLAHDIWDLNYRIREWIDHPEERDARWR